MEQLIYELKNAFDNGAYLLSLNAALTVPDICAALQSENGKTSGSKYINWFDRFVGSKYSSITGEDIWKLRCAALHQGKLNSDKDPKYDRIIFQLPHKNNIRFHQNTEGTSLTQLDLSIFIQDIIDGYKQWRKEMEGNENVSQNEEQMINYGITSFGSGLPPVTIIY